MSNRLPRWRGTLLAELRRSRAELDGLRPRLEPSSPVAAELAEEEHRLLEAERSLMQSLHERRARAALREARRRAADAEVLSDF